MEVSEEESPHSRDLMQLVSVAKRDKISKLCFEIDRKLSLYGEILVRRYISKTLGISNSNIIFETNSYGKPYLKGYPDFHFNISHTRNAVAVAFSEFEIGIDIEKIRDVDLRIAKRFFFGAEWEYIVSMEDKNRAFFEVWTKKEAYIKYQGKGLSIPLRSFDVFSDAMPVFFTAELNGYIISSLFPENQQDFSLLFNTEKYTVENYIL